MSVEPLIDACVRAFAAKEADIKRHLPPQLRRLSLGSPLGHRYVPPIDDFDPRAKERLGGSGFRDPEQLALWLFDELQADAAIVLPPSMVLRADVRHDVAVAAATNEWLAETWLQEAHGRWWGSIAVSLADPAAAVREIEKWAGHPKFVQVAVPLVAQAPYGEQRYFDIWAAATGHNLPIASFSGANGSIEAPASMAGMPTYFFEYFTQLPLNGMLHFGSLISEGVFDRLPDARFVFTDGGLAAFPPLLWRHDSRAIALKDEMPWVSRRPSTYLRTNARFVTRRHDLPEDGKHLQTALDVGGAGETLLYGSNTPMWDRFAHEEVRGRIDDDVVASRVFGGTALATYPRLARAMQVEAGKSA